MNVWAQKREADYLISLLAAAVNEEQVMFGRIAPSWERLFKLADYHHVANLAYYRIMWADDAGIWKERFRERYQSAIRLQEKYGALQGELEQKLEEDRIDCVFLGQSLYLPFYARREMRMPEPLCILTGKNDMERAAKLFARLGFEREEQSEKAKAGTLSFRRPGGLKAVVTADVGFTDKKVRYPFTDLPKGALEKPGRKYVRELEPETVCAYTMGALSEKYARGQIELRDIADLWVLLTRTGETADKKTVRDVLEYAELDAFADYLIKLAGKWFGHMRFPEDDDVLNSMQEYILSKGERARSENERLLPLIRQVADTYYRDLKKEEKKKWRRWMFPPADYMKASFPRLERFPFLLPVYWAVRAAQQRRYAKKEKKRRIMEEKSGGET